MNEAQCWLRGEDARGPVSGCHTSTARGAPPGDPPGGQRHTPELAQGPRTQPPAPSGSFPRASCLHKPSAPRRVRGQEGRGVGSDTVSSAASCGREPRGTRQRTATALSSGLSSSPERGAVLTASQRTAGEPLPGTDGPQRLVLTLENTAGPLGQLPQTPTRPWAPAPATLRRCPLGAGCLLTQRALQNRLRRSKLTSSDARKMPDEAVLAARGRTWLPAPLTSGRSRQTVVSPLS